MYSKYLRMKRHWFCEFCNLDCCGNKGYLTISHFYGRRKESVRFDDDNCLVLCRKCHLYLENNKGEYTRIMMQKLGEKRFNVLTVRANTIKKRDDFMDEIIIKEMMKDND